MDKTAHGREISQVQGIIFSSKQKHGNQGTSLVSEVFGGTERWEESFPERGHMKEQGLFYPDGSFRSRKDMIMSERPLWDKSVDAIKKANEAIEESRIGVQEAVWEPPMQYPNKPLVILLATDIHFGSTHCDMNLLNYHLDLVEGTPNTGMISNGDDVDNFNVIGKWATGTYENPLPPQVQTKAFMERIRILDQKGKLGVMSFGNHNNFMDKSGYDWLESFATGMNAPIFTSGGLLHILVGKEHYKLALTHKYWGTSKLNPTNAVKRFLQFEYQDDRVDVVFLGHTHQSEMLHFTYGNRDVIGLIGGTYKQNDTWAKQNGISGRAGAPGMAVALYPNKHRAIGFKHIEDALGV